MLTALHRWHIKSDKYITIETGNKISLLTKRGTWNMMNINKCQIMSLCYYYAHEW